MDGESNRPDKYRQSEGDSEVGSPLCWLLISGDAEISNSPSWAKPKLKIEER